MKTLDKILTDVDCKSGAPMGRYNTFPLEYVMSEKYITINERPYRIFDCPVPMIGSRNGYGVYDIGGAYWGYGKQLRVKYTKDLSYVEFYRK